MTRRDAVRFLKGHGTENDFLLLPDHDGGQGAPSPELVRAMCDRHAGLGADGVIRVVRTDATDDPAAVAARGEAVWFMDYRNSDGSLSEMCGNGVRVLGRYLVEHGGADAAQPLPIATRAGVKVLIFNADGEITVDMGRAGVHGSPQIAVADLVWDAVHVDLGNPHAVAFVDDLDQVGPLLDAPRSDPEVYPDGVNVEFVVVRGERHLAMRVHERGSGETRSCGTGACAVAVAAALRDGHATVGADGSVTPSDGHGAASYDVELAGGTLRVGWDGGGRVLLTGPAVLVAEGNWLAVR
ncbi:MAG: Diaminopimelate epimerase [uncultured Nocardioidaceae bacterium]|uniref:Diaminopimelate epimerase n=1 Tax=uncultured Nocardioidaceae bacterium TaxID=253824 RepID=A0A6J4MDT0_9ACTN|nr:MAG: Diaminopimelate epimerase [uncultured Nocardioidaceae bacterium]